MEKQIKLSIPNSMDDIKLREYQKYMKLMDGLSEDEKQSDFMTIKMLEIFCGADISQIHALPVSAFGVVVDKLNECLSEPTPFEKEFTIKGSDNVEIDFGFIPKLDDISFGEYIDLDTFFNWEDMHKAMAIMYRPIIKRRKGLYDIEVYQGADKYQDLMLEAPLSVAMGAMVFFYRLGAKLSNLTLNYSLQEMTETERLEAEKKSLEENGVGISQYMQSLKQTSRSMTKLQVSHYINV